MNQAPPAAWRCAARTSVAATLLLALAATQSCSVVGANARRAGEIVSAAQDREIICAAAVSCASQSPYRELVARSVAESAAQAPVHFVNLLDRGEDSLLLRVHLIRVAQQSIDIQTFIFAQDDAGLLVLDELVKAARRGVRVRVLTDQLFSLDDTNLLVQLARAHVNFELRVYNPTFNKANTHPLEFAAGILCCFFNFNQRMHNKLLLVDDAIGIAGGRNYENRYFDWDAAFDYRDRDVLVVGPATQQMRASFEEFWSHPRSVPLTRLRDVNPAILAQTQPPRPYAPHAYRDPARVAELTQRADDPEYIKSYFAVRALRVGAVEYFSDAPNKPLAPDRHDTQTLTQHIESLLRGAHAEIVLQTPYLVISPRARDVLRELHKRQPYLRVVVSTNSLAATDAFYVYAISYKYKKRYIKQLGFEIHEFKPFPAEAPALIARYAQLTPATDSVPRQRYRKFERAPLKTRGVRVGLHAKSIVIDRRVTLIGSHNFDPRSDHYNTESGLIVDDAAFAATVRESILRDILPENAWTIAKRPRPALLNRINNAIGDLSTALPIFDFWPFRYASSYEIDPGCDALPPRDPHFYECYTAVGDFPEVDLPLKTIYTRIITAFGAGLTSIL